MSAFAMTLNPMMAFPYDAGDARTREVRRDKAVVVGLVVLLHALVFAAYWLQPEAPAVMVNEMSVSFASMQAAQTSMAPQPKPQPKPREPEPAPSTEPAPPQAAPATPQADAAPAAAPVALDAEPDYRADYLNNPRPPYPMVARRMGYQGRVVLNVEVLAEGRAGQVLLHKSCGYDMLDNAAIQTVKSWRFTPARRLGQPVTQWFLVPIKFSLEEGNS